LAAIVGEAEADASDIQQCKFRSPGKGTEGRTGRRGDSENDVAVNFVSDDQRFPVAGDGGAVEIRVATETFQQQLRSTAGRTHGPDAAILLQGGDEDTRAIGREGWNGQDGAAIEDGRTGVGVKVLNVEGPTDVVGEAFAVGRPVGDARDDQTVVVIGGVERRSNGGGEGVGPESLGIGLRSGRFGGSGVEGEGEILGGLEPVGRLLLETMLDELAKVGGDSFAEFGGGSSLRMAERPSAAVLRSKARWPASIS
jgi:hypothetical protein